MVFCLWVVLFGFYYSFLSYLILPSISLSPIAITISVLCIESIRIGFALGRGHEKKGKGHLAQKMERDLCVPILELGLGLDLVFGFVSFLFFLFGRIGSFAACCFGM